jgi:hypothetical protein
MSYFRIQAAIKRTVRESTASFIDAASAVSKEGATS